LVVGGVAGAHDPHRTGSTVEFAIARMIVGAVDASTSTWPDGIVSLRAIT
jgi:hypothetical protein